MGHSQIIEEVIIPQRTNNMGSISPGAKGRGIQVVVVPMGNKDVFGLWQGGGVKR